MILALPERNGPWRQHRTQTGSDEEVKKSAKKAKACCCRSAVNGYDQPLPEELIKKIAKWCFEKYSK